MKHLSLTKPHLIIMVGIPGSGKSFFAEKFADTFGAPYVCDKKIAMQVQGNIEAVTQLQLNELLKTKQSIIFDGASNTRVERLALAKKARAAGYESLIIWVQTDPATAKSRATSSKKGDTPLLSSEEYDKLVKRFTPPNVTEKPLVISGKHTYATQAKVVLKRLSAPRAEISGHDTPPIRPERPKGRIIVR
ncbi:MAG TPA: AAA family ATPase [Candidatus Saccharimonadales bacterium]|nr:AAA family ATPase [Candidatus Saccharimonadales bacterium]